MGIKSRRKRQRGLNRDWRRLHWGAAMREHARAACSPIVTGNAGRHQLAPHRFGLGGRSPAHMNGFIDSFGARLLRLGNHGIDHALVQGRTLQQDRYDRIDLVALQQRLHALSVHGRKARPGRGHIDRVGRAAMSWQVCRNRRLQAVRQLWHLQALGFAQIGQFHAGAA